MAILQVGATPKPRTGVLDVTLRLFMRLVAAGCIVLGLQYWARLMGITDGGLSRFDLMEPHWQVASASLAVLLPVAAIGLWMEVSWGVVLWVAAAGSEVLMHTYLSDWFGERQVVVGLHLTVAITYLAFRFACAIRDRDRSTAVRNDSL